VSLPISAVKLRSIFRYSTTKWRRQFSEENPVPKPSMDRRTPMARNACRVALAWCGWAIDSDSVSSSSRTSRGR